MTKHWVIGMAVLVLATQGFAASSVYIQDVGDSRRPPARRSVQVKTKPKVRSAAISTRPLQTSARAYSIHVVKKGETLAALSRRYRVSVQALQAANRLKTSRIQVGQQLKIPAALPLHAPRQVLVQTTPVAKACQAAQSSRSDSPKPASKQAPSYLFINAIKPALDAPNIRQGRWRYIVLHHSGTSGGNAKIFEYFHRNVRGMENGMAYHFVIGNGQDSGDGQIEVGNRWVRQIKGGHVKGEALNEVSLGICFVGDFSRSRPTRRQIAAAIELISYLREKCGKPYPRFETHTEINPHHTQCPGKHFPSQSFHQLFD